MDGVTQQNAALVEEAAAAAESLQDQAHHLAEVIGVFKLGEQARQPAPAMAATPVMAAARKPAQRLAPGKAPAKTPATTSARAPAGDDWEAFEAGETARRTARHRRAPCPPAEMQVDITLIQAHHDFVRVSFPAPIACRR